MADGFVPPPYPYDRLDRLKPVADAFPGGAVDLSIGTPCDPPPAAVVSALAASDSERGYPPSIGTPALRAAASRWMQRRFSVDVAPSGVGACIGTKELVATLPQLLHLRTPGRDTVLYPAVSYPTYEMGAILAGCRAVPVPLTREGRLDLASIQPGDAERALCLWVNSPGNPTGALDDLAAVAAWGRANDVLVCSDECYVEFTWDGPGRTILEHGLHGVLAVHSLSKRSNLAGLRVGFYAGDPELVTYLQEVRKHVGMLVPGPAQAAAAVALDDDDHVRVQRDRYRRRLDRMAGVLAAWSGVAVPLPGGAFYLWAEVGDGWAFTERLAKEGGALVSPGEFYGPASARFVRVAVVQPDHGHRAGGRTARGRLMSVITNAPPPPPGAPPPQQETRIKPSGWWYLPAVLVLVGGVIGGLTLMVVGFVNLSRLVDDFARIEVVGGEGSERLVFDRAGRFVLYYEFESDIDGVGFVGADADLPAVIEATVRGPGTEGPLLLVRDERNDFSFSFSGNAGISFASVRIPEAGTYDVDHRVVGDVAVRGVGGSERVRPAPRLRPRGLALLGVGVVVGVTAIVVLAVKRGRRKRERSSPVRPRGPVVGTATRRRGGPPRSRGDRRAGPRRRPRRHPGAPRRGRSRPRRRPVPRRVPPRRVPRRRRRHPGSGCSRTEPVHPGGRRARSVGCCPRPGWPRSSPGGWW
jgi:succinyldiaminopimelate transaminase